MGIGKAKSPTVSNVDKCLICYGPHSHSDPAKSDEKGITFELKNLKDIFMKILGIQFLPHFSKYGTIHMCCNCHDEFLKVEKIYDDIEHGSEQNSHNFDAVREQFAFMIVESIMRSEYISNYVHGNAFDALRYLVFREWSGKFRKQEELKRGKHPGRIESSKTDIVPPAGLAAPVTPKTVTPDTTTKRVDENNFNKNKVQNFTPAPAPKPLPPPITSPQTVMQKQVKPIVVAKPDKNVQVNHVQAVATKPTTTAVPSIPEEPVKKLPIETTKSKPVVDSQSTTEKVARKDLSFDTNEDNATGSTTTTTTATSRVVQLPNVIANGKNLPTDTNSKDLMGKQPDTPLQPPSKQPVVSKPEESVLNATETTSESGQAVPVSKSSEPSKQVSTSISFSTEKSSSPTPPKSVSPIPNATTEKRAVDSQTSAPVKKSSQPEEPTQIQPATVAKVPVPVNNSQVISKVSHPVTHVSSPGIGNNSSTYILSADGQKLLSRTGKLAQNHKLIFVRRCPKTGKMIQVPKPNFDMVKGKLNGKEVIVRTAPPSNSTLANKPGISVVSANLPSPVATSQVVGQKTVPPSDITTSHSVHSNANKNPGSPLTPKIVAVQSVRQGEFNINAGRRKEGQGPTEISLAKIINRKDHELQKRNLTDTNDNGYKEGRDGIVQSNNFGLEISEAMEADHEPEPPLLQQQLSQSKLQQMLEKKQIRLNSKSSRSSSEESIPSQSQETEIRSVRSGRRIKRTYDSSSGWASGLELDTLLNQCVKDGRTDRLISPGKKTKYEVHRHGNLIIEPIDPIEDSPSPSPPILDKQSEEDVELDASIC